MNRRLILLFLLFIQLFGYAQTLPNSDFENWMTNSPYDPVGWISLNQKGSALVGTKGITVKKLIDTVHSGIYSARLESKRIKPNSPINYIAPGLLTFGKIDLDPPLYDTLMITGGLPFTYKPYFLKGYFKYSPVSEEDSALIWIYFLKHNPLKPYPFYPDTVGEGKMFQKQKISEFTPFSVPISYKDGMVSDTMNILIMSSRYNGTIGNVLYVDSLWLDYSSPVQVKIQDENVKVNVYPNPVSDVLTIELNNPNEKINILKIYNALGVLVNSESVLYSENKKYLFNTSDLPEGIYFLELENENSVIQKKIIISR